MRHVCTPHSEVLSLSAERFDPNGRSAQSKKVPGSDGLVPGDRNPAARLAGNGGADLLAQRHGSRAAAGHEGQGTRTSTSQPACCRSATLGGNGISPMPDCNGPRPFPTAAAAIAATRSSGTRPLSTWCGSWADGRSGHTTNVRAPAGLGHNGRSVRSSGDEPRNPPPAAAAGGLTPGKHYRRWGCTQGRGPLNGTSRTLRPPSPAGAAGISASDSIPPCYPSGMELQVSNNSSSRTCRATANPS
jgi:hypothetical protein